MVVGDGPSTSSARAVAEPRAIKRPRDASEDSLLVFPPSHMAMAGIAT